MLTHIVLIKLKDSSPALVQSVHDRMAAINGHIPQLRSLEVGINLVSSERAADLALVATFDSAEAMQAYQVHPVHVAMLNDVRRHFAAVTATDYESPPQTQS